MWLWLWLWLFYILSKLGLLEIFSGVCRNKIHIFRTETFIWLLEMNICGGLIYEPNSLIKYSFKVNCLFMASWIHENEN